VIATGDELTVIVAVLLADNVLEQLPFENDVTVIVDDPAVVNPVAVKVPVPEVETVNVAVKPVCVGDDVL
jgi:hypothetical protein